MNDNENTEKEEKHEMEEDKKEEHPMKNILERLWECKECHDNCLKDLVCRAKDFQELKEYSNREEISKPEPFLGNINPKLNFAIIGINPGRYFLTYENQNDYIESFMKEDISIDTNKFPGYLEAYRELVKDVIPNPDEGNFKEMVIVLNIIKCSTKKMPKNNIFEKSKENCKKYLIEQLKIIQPNIILVHGVEPYNAVINMLKNGEFDEFISIGTDLNDFPDYIVGYYKDSDEGVLFLFNKHLSHWCGDRFKPSKPNAKEILMDGIEYKREMVSKFLSQRSD